MHSSRIGSRFLTSQLRLASPRFSNGRGGGGMMSPSSEPWSRFVGTGFKPSLTNKDLTHRTFHLELDELVHLDGVFHGQLLDERLDEPADDQGRGLSLGEPS